MAESKIPTRTVPSDDCVIYIGREVSDDGTVINQGKAYKLHEGEWVKVIPLISVRQFIAWNKLRASLSKDTDRIEQGLDALCRELSNKILDWNWTDFEGNPLPKPFKNPEVFKDISEDELIWLSGALVETPAQRKNADVPSA